MIKFILAARRKPQDTQERYFYEWGTVHVALMVTTPSVMRTFRRYVQHYSMAGVSDDMLIHPLSPMAWDNMADHWMLRLDDMIEAVRHNDYVQRMQPHVFGDKEFVLQLMSGETVFEEEDLAPGGVKLIHFLKRKPGLSLDEFNQRWAEHDVVLREATRGQGLIRKYVRNRPLEFDTNFFNGTIFEHGGVNRYDAIEEFWFDNLDALARLRRDPRICQAIESSDANYVDRDGCFSMVTTERVIYDYTRGNKSSPLPAVLNPDSLEAAIYRQGLREWNVPPASGKDNR